MDAAWLTIDGEGNLEFDKYTPATSQKFLDFD